MEMVSEFSLMMASASVNVRRVGKVMSVTGRSVQREPMERFAVVGAVLRTLVIDAFASARGAGQELLVTLLNAQSAVCTSESVVVPPEASRRFAATSARVFASTDGKELRVMYLIAERMLKVKSVVAVVAVCTQCSQLSLSCVRSHRRRISLILETQRRAVDGMMYKARDAAMIIVDLFQTLREAGGAVLLPAPYTNTQLLSSTHTRSLVVTCAASRASYCTSQIGLGDVCVMTSATLVTIVTRLSALLEEQTRRSAMAVVQLKKCGRDQLSRNAHANAHNLVGLELHAMKPRVL
jgi:hypothetical protein